MLEYDFLRVINEHVKIYKNFPLPALIADLGFQVYWSNNLVKSFYSHITQDGELRRVLLEYEPQQIPRLLQECGSYTIRDVFPLSGVDMCFLPVQQEDETVGLIVLLMGSGAILDYKDFVQVSRTAGALSSGIRGSVGEIFGILDVAAAKADLIGVPWAKAGFERIGKHGYRVLRIAENIAEYSKYLGGGPQLSRRAVDLLEVLREMREPVGAFCQSMQIPISWSLDEGGCLVQLDIDKFETAFFNVLHNALYYTRPGNALQVTARRGGQSVSVTVADKGIGIPAQLLSEVCLPYRSFAQPDRSVSAGLGLTLAKIVAEAHGGGLEIRSKEGEGTEVTFHLPVYCFSGAMPLGQEVNRMKVNDRFSSMYVGLADAALSPFRDKH